jgi:non-lysosomal glucosylceramidase
MNLSAIPEAAWSRGLDEQLSPEASHTASRPPPMEIISLLPVAYRVAKYLHAERKANREPIFDLNFTLGGMEPPQTGPYNGVPLGGLGGGAIGRGYRGDFRRWSMHPGRYVNNIVHGNQFSVRVERNGEVHSQVLSIFDGDLSKSMRSWTWNLPPKKAKYFGLFPRAWTVYEEPVPGVNIILRQVSPVIPDSYSDASLPTAVFLVEVENIGEGAATISVMFSFENSYGEEGRTCSNKPHAGFVVESADMEVQGVCMSRTRPYKKNDQIGTNSETMCDQGSLSIASTLVDMYCNEEQELVSTSSLTVCRKFVIHEKAPPGDTALELWTRFHKHGEISSFATIDDYNEDVEVACAVCLKKVVPPGKKSNYPFSVSWDNPVARFGEGRGHYRYYTAFFSKNGLSSPSIAAYALNQVVDWEHRICEWQNPILENKNISKYYQSLLFNELYFLVDGGTIWTHVNDEDRGSMEEPSLVITESTCRTPLAVDLDLRDLDLNPIYESSGTLETDSSSKIIGMQRTEVVSNDPKQEEDSVSINQDSLNGVSREDLIKSMQEQATLKQSKADMIKHDIKVKKSEGNQLICGRFLYLEGHEYLMYNTYDVHFYASFSIVKLWPMIELSIQRDYASAVYVEDLSVRKMLGHGPKCTRKVKGCVPHDMGSPSEDPWKRVNIYNFQDVCNWKDLGPKFVLQVYRDFIQTKALRFLSDVYPVVVHIMEYNEKYVS